MPDIETAIFTKLSTDGPIAAAVGDRIAPTVIGQGSDNPFLVYSRLHTMSNQPLGMAAGLFATIIRIDAWADAPEVAAANIDLVKTCLDGFHGTVSGVRIDAILFQDRVGPLFDGDAKLFMHSINFTVCHN